MFQNTKIKESKDVYVGELAVRGEWIVANVETSSTWPVNSQKVFFRGREFWIIPLMQKHYPAVAMRLGQGESREDSEVLLMRFLSMLSWVERSGFAVDGIGGGSLPAPMGRADQFGYSICEEFDLSYFPEPEHPKAPLALALMREARGLNHPGYAFLTFYRVFEVAIPEPQKRKAWINDQVKLIKDHLLKEALAEITKQGVTDVATHIRESRRQAMAHANKQPIIDPDNPAEMRRMRTELPLIAKLAEVAIETWLGVDTTSTNFKKHLYELDNFKKLIGFELVDALLKELPIAETTTIDLPNIDVRIRRRTQYLPLMNMALKEAYAEGKVVHLTFASEFAKFGFRLLLEEERLDFDLFGSDLTGSGSMSVAAAEAMAEINRFAMDYFDNGQLQIFKSDTGELLSRKDAFIPLNMFQDHEAALAAIEKWKVLADRYRSRDAEFGDAMRVKPFANISLTVKFSPFSL